MTSGDAEAHENTVHRIFPRLGEVGPTDDVLKQLSPRASQHASRCAGRIGSVTAE